jgi:transcriptional regulator with XRE-family HTH domain
MAIITKAAGEWGLTMSMRSVFASNLRRLSSTRKSHAQVARDLGLNRQQFDNYIKGKNLPNETVVEKICEYFEVDLSFLFRSDNNFESTSGLNSLILDHRNFFDKIIDSEISERDRYIADGIYYVYFRSTNDEKSFVCSLIAIHREGGFTTFRRITRLRGEHGSLLIRTTDIHRGLVLHRNNTAFFLGIDTTKGRYPSILIANPVASRNVIYSGRSLVSDGNNFVVMNFCIVPASRKTKIWDAMRHVSFVSLDHLVKSAPDVIKYTL